MSEVSYVVDAYTVQGDWTDESKAFDNNEDTYAYTDNNGVFIRGEETDCDGTDLGTITAVDVRVLCSGDGDDYIDIQDNDGVQGSLTPPSSKGWTDYVTMDSAWHSWSKIQDFSTDFLVLRYCKSGKANQVNVYKVGVRVTFTPSGETYYQGLKVQGIGDLALCDAGVNPLRIRKGGITYGIKLVETDDTDASKVRIKTSTGIKSMRKYT